LKFLILESKVDLDVIKTLTEGMKQNSAFSRTLDGQADVIITRAAAVLTNFNEIYQTIEKILDELSSYTKEKPDPKILFTGGEKLPLETEVETGKLDAETLATLEKFKDK